MHNVYSRPDSLADCDPGLLQLQSTGSLPPGTIGKILSGRGVKRGDDISSGGRLSRRNADPVAEAERKAQQEKLYSLDLDRVLAGQACLLSLAALLSAVPSFEGIQEQLLLSVVPACFTYLLLWSAASVCCYSELMLEHSACLDAAYCPAFHFIPEFC